MKQIGLLISLILISNSLNARDDFQSWQWLTIDAWKTEKVRVYIYADNRIVEDWSEQRIYIVGPRMQYKASSWLSLGIGYVFIDVKNLNNGTWKSQDRLEFELNPNYAFSADLKLSLRNRLELRWIEGVAPVSYRSRHRVHLSKKLNFKFKQLKSIYMNAEIFYHYDLDKFNESRAIPLGLGFQLNEHLGLNIFYMIQSQRVGASEGWNHNHILGTHLKVNF